ncbi:FAD-dependent monooxygenase [Lacisediminihabitans profunda]|uniref:Monooxygenase n=1 Tax=Lacisediminihabitans profunda TaxID=2594790 RepID=A0A5C8UUB2_9MICO|nr:FAD-dependent monooxygenase [Lacisediminihabitans profunda]TXN31168.1 monooxygenase [Lacisediminihabitans profunda]
MSETNVPVLIVGGSLVGMTTAALLGQHGIRCLVVERHRGTAVHPRAALILQRSMEILRSLGLEETVKAKSSAQFDQDAAIMAVESLAGEEIAYYLAKLNDGVRDLSPSERLFATQVAIEPVLGDRARELGAETRFGTELVDFEQDADGVTAHIIDRDSGETSTVRSQYLIAADGSRSGVREKLGIAQTGRGAFSNSVTIYFHAEVEALLRGRSLGVIMVVNPTLQGFFRIEKPYRSGFLAVHGLGDPKNPNSDVWTDLTDEKCVELVRAGLGAPGIAVEIDDVMRWQASADVSDSFRSGRVLLVGDSAHVMPPYGGYGGNTGIHDAHNLAWKLAAVLGGRAAPELLDSYDAERRPVAAFTVEQAYTRYVMRAAPSRAALGFEPVVSDAIIDLGYRYQSSAIRPEADVPPSLHGDPREARGLPGTRAPHLFVERDGERLSTLDLFGTRFVVLAGSEGTRWEHAVAAASAELALPIDLHLIGGEGGPTDPDASFEALYGLTASGAVLVRPDGFIAWRAPTDEAANGSELGEPLAAILGRDVPSADSPSAVDSLQGVGAQ